MSPSKVGWLLVAAVAGMGCRGAADPAATPAPQPAVVDARGSAAGSAVVEPPPENPEHPLPKAPLYDLTATLADVNGALVPFDTWRGHPTVIAMFYATCKLACPVLIDEIKAFQEGLPAAQRDALRVLLISFDATRDTPAAMRALTDAHHLDLTRWRLVTAPEASARELAAVLGVKYRALDDGEYFHTSVVTLVDGNGVAVARIEGLGRSAAPLVAAMAKLTGP